VRENVCGADCHQLQGFVDLEYEIHADDPMPGVISSFAYMRGVLAGMGYVKPRLMRGYFRQRANTFSLFLKCPVPHPFHFCVKWVGNQKISLTETVKFFDLLALSVARPRRTTGHMPRAHCSWMLRLRPWCRVTMIAPAGFLPAHR